MRHHRRDGPAQRVRVQPLPRRQQHRLVPVMPLRDRLGEEPALDRRQRRLARRRLLHHRDRLAPGHRRQPAHRLVLEQLPRRQHQPCPARPRHHLQRQDRIPAQLEEVVVPAHRTQAQNLRPDPGDRLLRLAFGRRLGGALPLRLRQRLAIQLAGRQQRQRRQHHDPRRHHVVRQLTRQMRLQRGLQPLARLRRRDMRHQPLAARRRHRRHHRAAHLRVRQQPRLDLAGLDPVAPDLHLVVGPAEIVDRPVRTPPHHVPGPVHPRCPARHTGPARSAPPSGRHGRHSPAPARTRRYRARPPRPPAPAAAGRPAHRPGGPPPDGRSAHRRRRTPSRHSPSTPKASPPPPSGHSR